SSVYMRSAISFSFPSGVARISPSADTNSVHITSGPPTVPSLRVCAEYFAIMRRKGASVTSAMGASTTMGLGRLFQKDIEDVIPQNTLFGKSLTTCSRIVYWYSHHHDTLFITTTSRRGKHLHVI